MRARSQTQTAALECETAKWQSNSAVQGCCPVKTILHSSLSQRLWLSLGISSTLGGGRIS